MTEPKKIKFPTVGKRMLKSAVAVFITYLVYVLRGYKGIPFYTAIAAIQCIQPYRDNTRKVSGNRVFGTMNGAFWGLITLLIKIYILKNQHEYLLYVIVSFTIVAVMYTAVVLSKKTVVYFSCVVYLSIVMIHIGDSHPIGFVADRVIDTLIGVLIAYVISVFELPRKKDRDTLFVCGMDENLLGEDHTISDYSRVELNRMIDSGMQFTIATERTSASLLECIGDVRLKLPVITFNGAVLFDMQKKEYLKVQKIQRNLADQIWDYLGQEQFCCYSTALLQYTLVIYYNQFYSEVEEQIYQDLRSSLYRNYIQGKVHEDATVFYIMAVGEDARISNLYHRLKEKEWSKELRIVRMKSVDYKGNTYLKIYHKDSTKQNMMEEVKKKLMPKEVVTLGSLPNQYNITVSEYNHNELVKTIKKLYEPYFWQKKKTK